MTIASNPLKMASRTLPFFLLLVFSSVVSSQVDITTLSDWEIKSYSPHDLMVYKRGGSGSEYFGFTVDRPNCICGQPIFNLATTEPPEDVPGDKFLFIGCNVGVCL